ncbi:hypothetical protein [Alkalibaculum bacchi]|uniref:hypothetical protein n=1 Tax=Alkalibaculum bacchi TaxID=645887 RepID=UPI0026EA77D6|nr:hypothetical protein [Alkalibaculum bacchi]
MFDYIYNSETIVQKRTQIFEEFLKLSGSVEDCNFKMISTDDLKLLFELYDRVFFRNDFSNQYEGGFRFSLSKRMSKSAGLTLCPKNISALKPKDVIIEFRFGVNFFFYYELSDKEKFVSGIETHNALEALQLVLEHEICHAIEFILYHQSSCKKKRFKIIAKNLFNHSSSYHALPTNQEIAKEKLGLSIGNKVSFQYENEFFEGFINGIHKRATVMVKNKEGCYIDREGNKYTKYYVPLNQLILLK